MHSFLYTVATNLFLFYALFSSVCFLAGVVGAFFFHASFHLEIRKIGFTRSSRAENKVPKIERELTKVTWNYCFVLSVVEGRKNDYYCSVYIAMVYPTHS